MTGTSPLLSEKGESALAWADADFAVFPCHAGLKTPACEHGLDDATTDAEQIRRWWTQNPEFNIGVAPAKSDCFVLDVDPPLGAETLARLTHDHGPLPDTLTIKTPRGGFHYWFKGALPSTVQKLGPKLDTRGEGGYVLVAPSVVNGSPYVFASDTDAIAPAPEWIAERLAECTREGVAADVGVELDSESNIARARTLLAGYVASGHVAIEGNGGDNRTYAVACEVLNFGLSVEKTFQVMQDWNAACVPPWTDDDLRTKITNAREYSQNEAGAWAVPSAQETFAHALKFVGLQGTDQPEPFGNLLTCPVKAVQELIPGLIEKGIPNFLCGPGGSGKSRLKLQLGLCVAAGKSVFGRAVEQTVFVDLNAEDTRDEVERRSQAIARRLDLPASLPAHYWDRVGKDSALAAMYESGTFELTPFHAALRSYLCSIDGHKLVALDSCYDFVRFSGKAKIDEGTVNAFVKNILQTLCNETDSTLLVVWHPSQSGQERGDASGWSVAWVNSPRNRLSIAPLKDSDDAFKLEVAKRNHGRRGQALTLYYDGGALLPKSEVAVADQATRFLSACVNVAIAAAEQGTPIQRQRRLNTWMVDEIERTAGFRPSERDAKETLARAVSLDLLRYVNGSQHRTAGYYPPDQDRAQELAHYAKRGAGKAGDNV